MCLANRPGSSQHDRVTRGAHREASARRQESPVIPRPSPPTLQENMEPIAETAATFDLDTGGGARAAADPKTQHVNRRMVRHQSETVVTDDMTQTERELQELHPDGAPWLMSILRAYNKQKTDLEVRRCLTPVSPQCHPSAAEAAGLASFPSPAPHRPYCKRAD